MTNIRSFKLNDTWSRIGKEPVKSGSESFTSPRVIVDQLNNAYADFNRLPKYDRDLLVSHYESIQAMLLGKWWETIMALARRQHITYLSFSKSDILAKGTHCGLFNRPKVWEMIDQTGISAGCGNGLACEIYQHQVWAQFFPSKYFGVWNVQTRNKESNEPLGLKSRLSDLKAFAMLGETETADVDA